MCEDFFTGTRDKEGVDDGAAGLHHAKEGDDVVVDTRSRLL